MTQQAARWVAIVPGTGCHIVGTDDDGGDRKAAILCRPGTRGEVWVWLMDGTTKLSETWAATVPDVGCQVVKVN